MSNELMIECPHCGDGFALTEALAGPLLEQERLKIRAETSAQLDKDRSAIALAVRADLDQKHEAELAERDRALVAQVAKVKAAEVAELAARKAKQEADEAKGQVDLEVQRRVDADRARIEAVARQQGQAAAGLKVSDLEAQLAETHTKLESAERAEIDARRLAADAVEAKRTTELEVARRLDEERSKVREQAQRESDESHRKVLAEREEQIARMKDQIEDLRRTGAITSQQLTGDVQERDLLTTLQTAFTQDRFERFKKGQRGADLLQTVMSLAGNPCGTIVWESKQAKVWQPAWLGKLREDQRAVKADIAALASETLPDGVSSFDCRDEVWVTGFSAVVPLATALRHALIEVGIARRAGALAEGTKDRVFGYLTSPPFRQRVTGMAESYGEMVGDLDREKRQIQTTWAKREKQLERLRSGLAGFYGDLQGIVGNGLPSVEGLSLPAPEPTALPRLSVVSSDVTPAGLPDLV